MDFLPCYSDCFFCGADADGLQMQLRVEEHTVCSDVTLPARFQGYDGVAHGGIVTGLLDEVMWWTIFMETKKLCVTRKMDSEYLRPVICGVPYRITGRLLAQEKGSVRVSAVIENREGKAAARGTGLFMVARHIEPSEFVTKLNFRLVSPEMKEMIIAALK